MSAPAVLDTTWAAFQRAMQAHFPDLILHKEHSALDPLLIPPLTRLCARSSRVEDCLVAPARPGRYSDVAVRLWDGTLRMGGHRAMYLATEGPLPTGLVVRHTCDVRPCISPGHLLKGTHAENMWDAWERDRMSMNRARGEFVHTARLTASDVTAMRQRARAGESITSIATSMGLPNMTATAAIRGISWQHLAEPPVPGTSRPGTPRRVPTPDEMAVAHAMRAQGLAIRTIAKHLGISARLASRWCQMREAA